jgi:TRAP-type C4-dicarboxylate transport system substrate-binding protein
VFSVFGGGSGETASSSGPKKGQYVLKCSHALTENDPVHIGFLSFKEKVEAATQGVVEIQLFPAATLGAPEDSIEQAVVGSNVLAYTDAGRLGTYIPDFSVIGGPYLVDTYEELMKLFDTPTYREFGVEFEKKNMKLLAFNWYAGARQVESKIKATSPEEMRGVRMRSSGSQIVTEYVRGLGGNPVVLPMSEVYSALQQSVIDAVELHYAGFVGTGAQEQTKFLIKTNHVQHTCGAVVGLKWWNSLPKEYQAIVEKAYDEAAYVNNKAVFDSDAAYLQTMLKAGMQVVEVDVSQFKKSSMGVYEKLNLKGIYNKFMKDLGKPGI